MCVLLQQWPISLPESISTVGFLASRNPTQAILEVQVIGVLLSVSQLSR